MKEKVISTNRIIMVNTLAIIIAASIAIIVHALVPADINAEDFDSVFVKLLGFPVVAVSYFLLLFTHSVVSMQYFGRHSNMAKLQIGFRFGWAFALLYFFGMQEVVVEASPFGEWGLDFVSYQFFMGMSDALPALLLCMTVAYFTFDNVNSIPVKTESRVEKAKAISFITVAFFAERAIGYETGIITSSSDTYFIPCYLWTIIFGIVLGCAYVILYPIFSKEQKKSLLSIKLVILTLGINWIIFNSFIGLIFSGAMSQMFLRSGIDVVVLFLSSIVISKYMVEPDIRV